MCGFLSALVFCNGDVFTDPFTDSHDQLLILAGVTEKTGDEVCRVEFTPGINIADVAGYTLTVDERREPEWFAGVRTLAERKLRAKVAGIIINEDRCFVHGGVWIVTGTARIGLAQWCRLFVLDSAQVEAWDSTHVVARDSARVAAWGSAHVVAWDSAYVEAWGWAHVEAMGSAHVVARGSARVEARGSAHVVAWDSAHVVAMGSAHVVARGSAQVEAMGSARVEARDSAHVVEAMGSAHVVAMGSARVIRE